MEQVLTEEFQYIAVWGEVGGREAFLTQVPPAYGAFPDLEVYVEDVQVRELGQDLYLASFIQVETFPNVPPKRRTSAILRVEDGMAKWILFHLTFIDRSNHPAPSDE